MEQKINKIFLNAHIISNHFLELLDNIDMKYKKTQIELPGYSSTFYFPIKQQPSFTKKYIVKQKLKMSFEI